MGFLEEQKGWERSVEGMIDGIMGVVGREERERERSRTLSPSRALGGNEYVYEGVTEGKGKGKCLEGVRELPVCTGSGSSYGRELDNGKGILDGFYADCGVTLSL